MAEMSIAQGRELLIRAMRELTEASNRLQTVQDSQLASAIALILNASQSGMNTSDLREALVIAVQLKDQSMPAVIAECGNAMNRVRKAIG